MRSPVLNKDLSLVQGEEVLDVSKLVTEAGVEAVLVEELLGSMNTKQTPTASIQSRTD